MKKKDTQTKAIKIYELLSILDQLIRTGKSNDAKNKLELFLSEKKVKIPREYVVDLGRLARRLGLHYYSLNLLRPFVRPRVPVHPPASDLEKTTYAGALAKIGAFSEAQTLLKSVSPELLPEVYFHTCTILFQQWEYRRAIPLLKKYVRHKAITNYERLVGNVNLAAALVVEQNSAAATKLLLELLDLTQKLDHKLLHGNILELLSQLEIEKKNFSQAEHYLNLAKTLLGNEKSLSEFFVRKWLCVLRLQKQERPDPKDFDSLNDLKNDAIQLNHGESVRECDFLLALARKDQNIFSYVYTGTPYPSYRARMIKKLNFQFELPKNYIWSGRPLATFEVKRIFNLTAGQEEDGPAFLPPGSVLHRALSVLCMDFYKPVSEGTIFEKLFVTELFNPDSSPARVSQVIQRLRQWFNQFQIPIKIETENTSYRLEFEGSYGILIATVENKITDPLLLRLQELKTIWPYKAFSCKQAAAQLGCSVSSANRLLKWAVQAKKIKTGGVGRGIRYSFSKK